MSKSLQQQKLQARHVHSRISFSDRSLYC